MKYAIVLIAFWTGAAYAITPYQEGVRDYYSGLCYRARPYGEEEPSNKATQWAKGFDFAKKRDHNRVDRAPPHLQLVETCRHIGNDIAIIR
jgi:hypothetical protein